MGSIKEEPSEKYQTLETDTDELPTSQPQQPQEKDTIDLTISPTPSPEPVEIQKIDLTISPTPSPEPVEIQKIDLTICPTPSPEPVEIQKIDLTISPTPSPEPVEIQEIDLTISPTYSPTYSPEPVEIQEIDLTISPTPSPEPEEIMDLTSSPKPYLIQYLPLQAKMVHCINAHEYNHAKDMMVNLDDLKAMFPEFKVMKLVRILRELKIKRYRANPMQEAILKKHNRIKTVAGKWLVKLNKVMLGLIALKRLYAQKIDLTPLQRSEKLARILGYL